MKSLISITLVLCIYSISWGQQSTRGQFWFSAGIKREIKYDLEVNLNTNLRLNNFGELATLYQEASVKYTKLDWFRPSIEYRIITNYDERRNYDNSHRLNFNADFRHKIEQIKFGARLRYQMYIGGFVSTGSDLDPAFRIKPHVAWDRPKSKITPEASVEFFYNPNFGPYGNRFNRVRYGLTLDFDLPKSNKISLTYYYGQKFSSKNNYSEHILSLEYTYEWKKAKKKKKKEEEIIEE
ncbi:DUF2490 domain-containing protein [Fluviicola taffensis]|uniref:DUF2490 domain-containing protein n=1 Tax=Fluviicola taffensis (strain DSM 16823 / NCIMB 13979 / RW262) TaxID=755732 RepID=F2IJ19_FLUTR|nr:DUF2490 domain-containing protein [Fluviicola taffensis]AEA43877.1 Protein of unknown function DUF2490 [Fluviicola taffensis DSM 16823]